VAVANAQQFVLDVSDEVIPSNIDDGVAVLLERIVAAQAGRAR
jgi:hydroxymethylpyrimidine pyrophosphatase-like HAD family hydrolase